MTHPSSLLLESFAVGEPLAPAHAAHVEACAACAAFVEQLRGVMAGGPSAEVAERAVAKALADVDAPRASHDQVARARQRKLWRLGSAVIAPLAAAAAIVLLTRGGPQAVATGTAATASGAPSPTELAATAFVPTGEPETQFKGGTQLAVVRERGGKQERFSSTVRVRPGDRLRLEVALDHEQAILGAVLADDGSYLELMPLGTRGPGTHFSERSAKIDAAPTRGILLVGTPDAVARARATKQLEGVGTIRVEMEP